MNQNTNIEELTFHITISTQLYLNLSFTFERSLIMKNQSSLPELMYLIDL